MRVFDFRPYDLERLFYFASCLVFLLFFQTSYANSNLTPPSTEKVIDANRNVDRRPAVLAPPIYDDELNSPEIEADEGNDTFQYLPPTFESSSENSALEISDENLD